MSFFCDGAQHPKTKRDAAAAMLGSAAPNGNATMFTMAVEMMVTITLLYHAVSKSPYCPWNRTGHPSSASMYE